jgi:hypothetical protein
MNIGIWDNIVSKQGINNYRSNCEVCVCSKDPLFLVRRHTISQSLAHVLAEAARILDREDQFNALVILRRPGKRYESISNGSI